MRLNSFRNLYPATAHQSQGAGLCWLGFIYFISLFLTVRYYGVLLTFLSQNVIHQLWLPFPQGESVTNFTRFINGKILDILHSRVLWGAEGLSSYVLALMCNAWVEKRVKFLRVWYNYEVSSKRHGYNDLLIAV